MTRQTPELIADDVFVCESVERVTDVMSTWVFAPRDGRTLEFQAGQYVTMEFGIRDQSVMRCYTISTPPTRPERIAITAKQVPGGLVTPWLHAGGVTPGTEVRVGEPQGSCTLDAHPAPAYALLTAGSGITPALSILRELDDRSATADVVLIHSERRVSEIPYRAELDALTQRLPGLAVHYICSEPAPEATAGRLNAERLAALVPDLRGRSLLICGPRGYRQTVRSAAISLGAPSGQVYEESFILEEAAASRLRDPAGTAEEAELTAAVTRRVKFRSADLSIEIAADMTVLDAAIAAGLSPAMSCTEGMCGTCKTDLLEGQVEMHHQGGIRPREIADGKFLPCCSRPLTDLVVA